MFCLKSLQSKELLLPPRLGSGPGKLPCLEGLALEQAQIQEYVVSYPDKPCFLSASVRAPASASSSWRCPGAARRWLSGLWRKDFDGEVAPLSCSWQWGQKPARGFCGSAAKMLRAAADAGGGGGDAAHRGRPTGGHQDSALFMGSSSGSVVMSSALSNLLQAEARAAGTSFPMARCRDLLIFKSAALKRLSLLPTKANFHPWHKQTALHRNRLFPGLSNIVLPLLPEETNEKFESKHLGIGVGERNRDPQDILPLCQDYTCSF